jgi:hypothetical protein
MRWLTPQLKSSFMAVLGGPESVQPAAMKNRLEEIRSLMLKEIGELGEKSNPGVARRIRYAPDVHGLWYIRSDVMAILAGLHGETVASEKIARISGMFKGMLPGSLSSRPSSLTR